MKTTPTRFLITAKPTEKNIDGGLIPLTVYFEITPETAAALLEVSEDTKTIIHRWKGAICTDSAHIEFPMGPAIWPFEGTIIGEAIETTLDAEMVIVPDDAAIETSLKHYFENHQVRLTAQGVQFLADEEAPCGFTGIKYLTELIPFEALQDIAQGKTPNIPTCKPEPTEN